MTLAPNQPLAHPERPVVAAEGEHSRAVPPVDARVHAGSTHRFRVAMAGVVVLAAAVQAAVLAVVGSSNLSAWARFDAAQARMLESGAWFTDPTIAPLGSHHLVPTVANSPLTPLVIAGVDVAGMTTSTWHRLVFAGIFVVAVVLIGLAVRDVAGPRPGVLAALLAAVFPPLVVCPATLGADTLVVATVALVLFATTRFWHDPGTPRGALLGFALALAAMARIDLMALVLLIGIPAVLLVRGVVLAGRVRCLGAVLAVFVLCLAPWATRAVRRCSRLRGLWTLRLLRWSPERTARRPMAARCSGGGASRAWRDRAPPWRASVPPSRATATPDSPTPRAMPAPRWWPARPGWGGPSTCSAPPRRLVWPPRRVVRYGPGDWGSWRPGWPCR